MSAAEPAAGTAHLLGPLPHDQLDRDQGVDADGQDQGQEDVDGCRGRATFSFATTSDTFRRFHNHEKAPTRIFSFHFMSTYQAS